MPQALILFLSDDVALVPRVSQPLTSVGYRLTHLPFGAAGLRQVQVHPPDLLIVDVPPGGTAQIDFCKRLKCDALTAMLPIILLTDSNEEAALIVGLAIGIDDYLTKSFSPQLLCALVQAVLRRTHPKLGSDTPSIELGALHMHAGRHEVHVHGRAVPLTPTEFRILYLLVQQPEQTWERQQIVTAVRGEHANVTLRSVDAHIAALRRKLGLYGRRIRTVRGVGYCWYSQA